MARDLQSLVESRFIAVKTTPSSSQFLQVLLEALEIPRDARATGASLRVQALRA
jgi:hypothetical protein